MTEYTCCTLCPRECKVDRRIKTGFCGMNDQPFLARAALHYWEEPCLSGNNGSGTIFFSGCNMRCIYCQNHEISAKATGKIADTKRLCEIYFELKEKGANNINFVTPTHFMPHIRESIKEAKKLGFDLPFIYNSSGYDKPEVLKTLDGLIDIYLPDYKYARSCDAMEYSFSSDYPEKALTAIDEMIRQNPIPLFENGLMKKGVIIRHLLLPGKLIESKIAIKRIYQRYGNNAYISLMSQYTPMSSMSHHPLLSRRVSGYEYKSLIGFAMELGIKNAYIQELESVGESFIPVFDGSGV